MKLALIPIALTAALAFSQPASADDYTIDMKGNHASINFRIKHLGFSWIGGRFDRFTGTFSYDEKNAAASKVKVEIDTSSLNSNHAERDKHLKSADFLDAGKFPTAVFESTAVKAGADGKADISGKLTMHGVTKDVTIKAAHVGGGDDPWGGHRQGFTGTTTLVLDDFGINTAKLGPASKTVELILDIEGVRQ